MGGSPAIISGRGWASAYIALLVFCFFGSALANPIQISTYHGDTLRTGWNANETALTPATVGSAAFKQLGNVVLDGQVDAQPLFVGSQTITGQGIHNVVYVATENNTVYAIDGDTGSVLLQRNFGAPVPIAQLPGQCNNNSSIVGINSTPVLDTTAQALYVITYTFINNAPVFTLHALNLQSLTDEVAPVIISGSGVLNPSNGKYNFNPAASRQRSALLLSQGNVYAAFSSFCDQAANVSRGWVLGWNAATLTPLTTPALFNRDSTSTNSFFLSSVWMSGYGIAANSSGSLYVVTGNSDPAGTAYNPPYGMGESVVKLSSDLTTLQSYFTPAGGSGSDYASLDANDGDFGSGGVMLLPVQPGPHPNIAVAAGKFGAMYMLDANNLGGHNQGAPPYPDNIFNSYVIGPCWCGESYFQAADGVGRVVSSGGTQAIVWKINNGANPSFSQVGMAPLISGQEQDGGFFTSVSSNGTQANSQIIWAVGRPINTSPASVTLYAFDPSTVNGSGTMATVFSGAAGSWPFVDGNADLVPTVANGKVYVASYQQLAIFGLSSSSTSDVVSFTAHGTQAAGIGPLVNVIVDGKTIGSTSVGTATATYSFNTTLAPNTAHDIQIQYTNDAVINGQDRNLFLNSIGIDGKTYLSTSSYEVYHAEAGNQGDFVSDGNMYWAGTAEFSLPATLFPTMTAAVKAAKTLAVAKLSTPPSIQPALSAPLAGHSIYGTLIAMQKGSLTLRTRTGRLVTVDNSLAVKSYRSVIPTVGGALLVRGEYDAKGVLHARSILRAKALKALWSKDS
jgi:hypothetical protein